MAEPTELDDRLLKPLWAVAEWLERSRDTVRDWYRHGRLTHAACDLKSRQVLVNMAEAADLAAERPARATRGRVGP